MSGLGLRRLTQTAPTWFTIEPTPNPAVALVGLARPPETVWRAAGLRLRLRPGRDRIVVEEAIPGTRLPKRCSERHIQSDSTLCLGLDAQLIRCKADAEVWWHRLAQWLLLQSTADQTGVWPSRHSLDHGDAGRLHRQCLALAAKLGVLEAFERAHAGEPSWITSPDGTLERDEQACPLGCPVPRCGLQPLASRVCGRREGLRLLIVLDRRRRKALDDHWALLRGSGAQCCGTMLVCPLRLIDGFFGTLPPRA